MTSFSNESERKKNKAKNSNKNLKKENKNKIATTKMFQQYGLSAGESATRTRLFLPCVILWLYVVFHPSISFLQTEH